MTCKDTERMIPAFLGERLEYANLKLFLRHIDECPDCTEELTVQYLVMKGAALLEEGGGFDLRKELDSLLLRAQYLVRRRRLLTAFSYVAEAAAIAASTAIFLLALFD